MISDNLGRSEIDDHSNTSIGEIDQGEDQNDTLPTFGGLSEEPTSKTSMKSHVTAEKMLENEKQIDEMLINEICSMIRQNCHEEDVVRLVKQYQLEKARLINMHKNQMA